MRDRVYYQVLCDAVAPDVEKGLVDKQVLFSYRLEDPLGKEMFGSPSESYAAFSSRLTELCEEGKHEYVVEADVAAYFEHVYHHVLVNTLRAFRCDPLVVDALEILLRKWRDGVSFGIPQGLWPSDLLGNLYLHPLDDQMVLDKWEYLRYVDDIRVFTSTKTEAKKVLVSMSKKLARLGLTLNSAKTQILLRDEFCGKLRPGSEKLQTLVAKRRDFLKALNPYFSEFGPPSENPLEPEDIDLILEIMRDATTQHPMNEGDLKFALKALFGSSEDEAKATALNLLVEYPHMTSYIINYLASAGHDEKVASALVAFLGSAENIYEWQEMWILRYFFTAKRLPKDLHTTLRQIAVDRNKSNACRCVAIHLLGELGNAEDWRALKEQFNTEDSNWVRSYLVLGTRQLPRDERNHDYLYWKLLGWDVDLATQYIKEKFPRP
jgi:hypothetical protein